MADYVVQCPTAGAIWQKAITLWDQYATGVYTSWAFAYGATSSYRAWLITVGLSGGGTDTYNLVGLDCEVSARPPLTYVTACPGFRAPPPNAYPSLLPDGNGCNGAFQDGPWALRKDIISRYASATINGEDTDVSTGSFGVDTKVWFGVYKRSDGMIVLDASGVASGTPAAGTTYAYPSDFIGESTPQAGAGGGGSTDLTPVVAALNEIANKDITISLNNGETMVQVWSAVEV